MKPAPPLPPVRLRACPLLYEVNAWVWLHGWQRRLGRPLTLGELPEVAIAELVGTGADAVWLMGVWERSPAGRQQALHHPDLQHEYQRALPDVSAADVVGSPYAIHRYEVAPELGGEPALRALRARLAEHGVGLILDLVPNHVAIDHPWLTTHPEALVRGSETLLHKRPDLFFRHPTGQIFAHGRDPYFPPWTDTAQLDAQSPTYRLLLTRTLRYLSELCDGVRCDMAMLLLNPGQTGAAWFNAVDTLGATRCAKTFGDARFQKTRVRLGQIFVFGDEHNGALEEVFVFVFVVRAQADADFLSLADINNRTEGIVWVRPGQQINARRFRFGTRQEFSQRCARHDDGLAGPINDFSDHQASWRTVDQKQTERAPGVLGVSRGHRRQAPSGTCSSARDFPRAGDPDPQSRAARPGYRPPALARTYRHNAGC